MAAEWLPSQWGFNTIAVGQRVGSNAPADGAGDLNWGFRVSSEMGMSWGAYPVKSIYSNGIINIS